MISKKDKPELDALMLAQMRAYALHAENDGWYLGPQKYFINRHKRIMQWIDEKLAEFK